MSDDPKTKKGNLGGFFRVNTQGNLSHVDSPNEKDPTHAVKEKEPTNAPDTAQTQDSIRNNDPVFDVDEDLSSGFTQSISIINPNRPKDSTKSTNKIEPFKGKPAPTSYSSLPKTFPLPMTPAELISIQSSTTHLTPEQVETLKLYIQLKETELTDLREQLQNQKALWNRDSKEVRVLMDKNRQLFLSLEEEQNISKNFKTILAEMHEKHVGELLLIKNDYEEKLRKSSNIEQQMADLLSQKESFKSRVREELNRIKLKEKELENKYELLKRDMQALLDSKDKHVLELKKKNDALELELENFEEKLRNGHAVLGSIDSKKRRLIETMKLAISLLEEIDRSEDSDLNKKRSAG